MPKQTFYNISEEKRQKFIEVVLKEFSTKSYDLVSVNSIIKSMGIPRGSFYTYFENLDELFDFVFKDFRMKRQTVILDLMVKNDFNLENFIYDLFKHDYNLYIKDSKSMIFKNFINYIKYSKHRTFNEEITKPIVSILKQNFSIIKIIENNKSTLKVDDFFFIIELNVQIMLDILFMADAKKIEFNIALEELKKRIQLVNRAL